MNRNRALSIGVVSVGLFLGATGASFADGGFPAELRPAGGSGVSGTATLMATANGSALAVNLTGLTPNVSYAAQISAGSCATPGASVARVITVKGDAQGHASGTGDVLFHGTEPVQAMTLADGDHVVHVVQEQASGSVAEVACGAILQTTSGVNHLPSAGGPGLSTLVGGAGALGLALIGAGRAVRRSANRR